MFRNKLYFLCWLPSWTNSLWYRLFLLVGRELRVAKPCVCLIHGIHQLTLFRCNVFSKGDACLVCMHLIGCTYHCVTDLACDWHTYRTMDVWLCATTLSPLIRSVVIMAYCIIIQYAIVCLDLAGLFRVFPDPTNNRWRRSFCLGCIVLCLCY